MMTKPDISVVMSVFNCASTLGTTLDSILDQAGVNLELIAINDGSTDESKHILSSYVSRDPRITVLDQENSGLTDSLIRGCTLAQGVFIARQDAGGDVSLPGRLAHQKEFLQSNEQAVMTACGTRFVDTHDQELFEVCQNGVELHSHLCATSLDYLRGPSHHGAVMFRRSTYERVGGYRSAFRVAQDLDLWSRMAEVGACLAAPEIFYVARLARGSISHLNREQQGRATRAILRCAKARREGRDDSSILAELEHAEDIRTSLLADRVHDAQYYYFLGSVLRTRKPQRASSYFIQALCAWPLHLQAWFGLFRSYWRSHVRLRLIRR